jgi:hypothetical protein
MVNISLTLSDIRELQSKGILHTDTEADGEAVTITFLKPKHMATGAEIKDFFNNGWPKDYYHESDYAEMQVQDEEGNWILDADQNYDLSLLGELEWQGSGLPTRKNPTFEEAFLTWKGQRNG